MDVGAPSNFERLAALPPEQRDVRVELVEDDAIRARIRAGHKASGYVWCPHSAAGAEAHARLSDDERGARPWIVAATAHPYKFAEIVEPLIGERLAPPPALAAIRDRPAHRLSIPARLDALADALQPQDEPPAA